MVDGFACSHVFMTLYVLVAGYFMLLEIKCPFKIFLPTLFTQFHFNWKILLVSAVLYMVHEKLCKSNGICFKLTLNWS